MKYRSSVLLMEATNAHGDTFGGSCFLITNHNIVTCQHNIESGNFKVHLDADTILDHTNFNVLPHPERDVAILTFKSERMKKLVMDITTLELGVSQGLIPGDTLITLGYPLVALRGTSLLVDAGIFMGNTKNYIDNQDYVTFTNKIDGGCSGGPVLSTTGMVIGVITESTEQSNSSQDDAPRGIQYNHGTPVEEVKKLL